MTNFAKSQLQDALLGAVILSPKLMDGLDFDESAFGGPEPRLTYRKLRELWVAQKSWDLVTLSAELGQSVSARYLADIVDNAEATVMNFKYYVGLFKKMLIHEVVDKVVSLHGKEDPFLVSQAIEEMAIKIQDESQLKTMSEIALDLFKTYEKASERAGHITGVPSLLKPLDQLTWGFQPGRLYMVAGRPSMGKSALSVNIAANSASKGFRIYYQSLEESRHSLGARILARLCKIPNEEMNKGNITADDWPKIGAAIDKMSKWDIIIDDASNLSSAQITARVKKHHAKKKIDLVIVDHLQEIREGVADRKVEVGRAASGMKMIAKTLEVPVILLSQLRRADDSAKDKRPRLNDLKESGDIEAVADTVMMLHRESYYNDEEVNGIDEMEVLIRKNRDGRTGVLHLGWNPSIVTFSDLGLREKAPPTENKQQRGYFQNRFHNKKAN